MNQRTGLLLHHCQSRCCHPSVTIQHPFSIDTGQSSLLPLVSPLPSASDRHFVAFTKEGAKQDRLHLAEASHPDFGQSANKSKKSRKATNRSNTFLNANELLSDT